MICRARPSLCFLLNLESAGAVATSPLVGAIWEARRHLALSAQGRSLFFWSDWTGEVDFLLDRGGSVKLADAKWAELPDAKAVESIQYPRARLASPRRSRSRIS